MRLSLITIATILFNFSSAKDLKNVLFVTFDDLRPALKCYGDDNAVTPNIDRIARDGIIFKHVYAQQSLCAPSRNSLLTSRRPDTLHLYDFYSYWRTFAGNFTTLPQYFKENGYHTKSIGKIFHPGISSNFSDDQPYSWSEPPFHPSTLIYKNAEVCFSDDEPFVPHKNVVCPVRLSSQPGGTLPDMETTQEAVKFLRRSSTGAKPFFLAVGYHKPHLPLKYPKHFDDYHDLHRVVLPDHRSRPPQMPDIAWNPWADLRERYDVQKLNLTFPYEQMPDSSAKLIRRSYYAAVTYVDSLLGQIIDQLMESSLYEETVIVLLGDHGWALGENGEWSKYNNYESTTRVPLVIRAPSKSSNMLHFEINEDIVELLDVFPTLAHLAGLPDVPPCEDKNKDMLCTEGKNLFQKNQSFDYVHRLERYLTLRILLQPAQSVPKN
ncbi:unnamed protein product [Nesidiocoris tenuis]|uniref:Sulfatase N-terminal domain-containing protein n=1 Tax=Nesidiocoris tenuis TaxID=355587 RepID=A0A6H5FZV2_9HEMI|nr:unnamed protein product [Nesidiocoris tenuis]